MNRDKLQDKWLSTFKQRNALWLHDGNIKRPHVKLHAGDHSGGYFDGTKVTNSPAVLSKAVADLYKLADIKNLVANTIGVGKVDCIVGSAMGAIPIAYALAEYMGVEYAYTEKIDGTMKFGRHQLSPGDNVILVEDVITSGDTTFKTKLAVEEAEAHAFNCVLALANRSGLNSINFANPNTPPITHGAYFNSYEIFSLIDLDIETWNPEECPKCAGGSELIDKPKERENWARLTANYD